MTLENARIRRERSEWWQIQAINPDVIADGWLSWDHEFDRPFRFDTEDEAFAALETWKREDSLWFTWRLAAGWSARVVRVRQDQSYFDVEYPDGHDTPK